MCTVFINIPSSKNEELIVVSNRDEFYNRPTDPLQKWNNGIIAGKDLEAGGTWFSVSTNRNFIVLTNYRDPSLHDDNKKSRGEIPLLFHELKHKDFTEKILKEGNLYNPFNIIFGSRENVYYFNNINNTMESVSPGVHGLSNHFINTPWPKVETGKREFSKIIEQENQLDEYKLVQMMKSKRIFPDQDLPQTGVSIDLERKLSALFIKTETYGTRTTTLLYLNEKGGKIVEFDHLKDKSTNIHL